MSTTAEEPAKSEEQLGFNDNYHGLGGCRSRQLLRGPRVLSVSCLELELWSKSSRGCANSINYLR